MKSYNIQSIRTMISVVLVSAALCVTANLNAQSAQILHNPAQVEVAEGDTFEVKVEIHSGIQPIAVADFYMEFNPEYLEVLEVNAIFGGLFINSIEPSFDNAQGTISMGAFQLGSQAPSGFIESMQITFLAVKETQLTSVEHPANIFPKSILAYAGEDHLGNVGPLDITILPGIILSDSPELRTEDFSLEIWPNPTSEQATVSFRANDSGEASLALYDVSGKMVSEIFRGTSALGTTYRFDIDVKSLENGLYLCRLTTDSGDKVKHLVVSK